MDRSAVGCHEFGICALMRSGRHHKRNQHAGESSRSQLRNSNRPRAANHEVCLRVAIRHIVDKRNDFGVDTDLSIQRAHRLDVFGTALMNHPSPQIVWHQREALAARFR